MRFRPIFYFALVAFAMFVLLSDLQHAQSDWLLLDAACLMVGLVGWWDARKEKL